MPPMAQPDLKAIAPQSEHVCGKCITDEEICLELAPVVDFVLSAMLSQGAANGADGEYLKSLEIARAYFHVYNNEDDSWSRSAAVRAAGLDPRDVNKITIENCTHTGSSKVTW